MILFFPLMMKFGDGGGQPNMLRLSKKLLTIQVKCGIKTKMDPFIMLQTQIISLIKITDTSWLLKLVQRKLELIKHSQNKKESGSLIQ